MGRKRKPQDPLQKFKTAAETNCCFRLPAGAEVLEGYPIVWMSVTKYLGGLTRASATSPALQPAGFFIENTTCQNAAQE